MFLFNKIKNVFFIFLIGLILFINLESHAIEHDIKGQLSGWMIESEIDDHWENSAGIRYIPGIDISHQLDDDTAVDSEISLNMFS
ncbi:MAG: hypothetical protein JXL81_12550, partial [Deltaproteobacteria bacterium]|nr:hypothetical protein [Deltaproteobacteria bacterium]